MLLTLPLTAEARPDVLHGLLASGLPNVPEADGARAEASLYPYLEYATLRQGIEDATADEVESWLTRYSELPVTPTLRVAWLQELARREDWPQFLDTYADQRDTHVRCALVEALRAGDRQPEAIIEARRLWLVGYRQPEPCLAAFDFLEERGELTPKLIQRRILLALEAGDPRLAGTIAERLEGGARSVADYWIRVHEDPEAGLDLETAALGPRDLAARALSAGTRALARRDPEKAHELWSRLVHRHALDEDPEQRVRQTIALFAVYNDIPEGRAWLWELPEQQVNGVVHAWRLRGALRAADWAGVVRAAEAMPRTMRDRARWRYWQAHALERLGEAEAARRLYQETADEFGYYGFLAADRVGAPYHWGAAVASPEAEREKQVRTQPAVTRALLLHRVHLHDYAQLEWRALIGRLGERDRLAAARIAEAADWPWATLYASGAAGVDNASSLRFPRSHVEAVRRGTTGSGVDASWLFSIIRQESAFQENACSRTGACGLMQLMPGTAGWMLERAGKDAGATREVLRDPERNIATGAAYFAYLLERFDDPLLAVTAYNAGPGTVTRWIEADGPAPGTPRWVETLLYGETRDYVQAVLFNNVVYRLRLEDNGTRLSRFFGG